MNFTALQLLLGQHDLDRAPPGIAICPLYRLEGALHVAELARRTGVLLCERFELGRRNKRGAVEHETADLEAGRIVCRGLLRRLRMSERKCGGQYREQKPQRPPDSDHPSPRRTALLARRIKSGFPGAIKSLCGISTTARRL
ncbi:MAG TPA: hypothetical protein VI321_01165 [Burkholderiales bacterium]